MKRQKKLIKYGKEKVVFTDILPYELPPTFSNRRFYEFLVTNGIRLDGESVKWDKDDKNLEVVLRLLFGIKNEEKAVNKKEIKLKRKNLKTIPFHFKTAHKENDFRELTVIHPKIQLAVVEFYEKYKELILYFCNISPFSIRRPCKVARTTFYNDRIHLKNLAYDHEHESVEDIEKEYNNQKTFFAYKDYSNIYKFYESYEFHRCEKKYNRLLKFDISKCFDSIYTHTISWAFLNKGIVKNRLGESDNTFSGKFDSLMQYANEGETNGIVIGPEFSRIFAEIILQKIDLNVFHYLKSKGLNFKDHYKIFRYVDDFFVFYNEESTKDIILNTFKLQLREYNLYLNDKKENVFDKPIITGITIAKQRISDLMGSSFKFKIPKLENKNEENDSEKYSIYHSSNKLITRLKTIIKESNVPYKDILNYTIACVDRKVVGLIDQYAKIEDKSQCEGEFTKTILEVLDFSFFFYSVYPRTNTTIKLCLVLSKLIKLTKHKKNFNHEHRHMILKKIYDDIFLVLRKNLSSEHTQIETLYLLVILKELGQEYLLDENVLCRYLYIDLKKKKPEYSLNYFSIIVLLFYIEKRSKYARSKEILKNHIIVRFKEVDKNSRSKTTELTFLLFDLLACPYLDVIFKKDLLKFYEIEPSAQNIILSRKDCWFTKWDGFDIVKELEAKRSQEVY